MQRNPPKKKNVAAVRDAAKSETMNIMILCTGNSCRSQMMHGYLEHYLGSKARIYSAGVETHGLNPRAVEVMQEDGISIAHHTSNLISEYQNLPIDFLITVCDHARERCPVLPGTPISIHQSFPDPAKATGTETAVLEAFRAVRDQIRLWARNFAATI